jgi:hypothetical protein
MFQLAMLPAMGKDCNQLTSEGLGCDRVAMLSEMGEEVNGPPSEGPGCVRVAILLEMGKAVWASSTSCSNTWYVICRPPHQIWTCNKRRPLGLEQSAGRGWLAGSDMGHCQAGWRVRDGVIH